MVGSSKTMRSRLTYALLCALTLVVCVICARPFVEMGVNDDWSYIRSAQAMAQTGHIQYFGWTSPILGWQLFLGAIFTKIFGFSFSVTRASILLVAAITAFLMQRTLIHCGITERNATFGTLTLVLSPLFLPLSFSFMSDMAGFFSLLLCIYLCIRALQATTDASAFNWIALAALSNVLSGTVRQTSWLGLLIIIPSAIWLLRRRLPLLKTFAVWAFSVALVLLCIRWFQHQPYTMAEKLIEGPIARGNLRGLVENVVRFCISIALFTLPVLIAFLTPAWVRTPRARKAMYAALALILLVTLFGLRRYQHHTLADILAPFSQNYVTEKGLIDIPSIGIRGTVLSVGVRALVTLATFAGIFAFIASLTTSNREPEPSSIHLPLRSLLFLLAPFTCIYLGLLIPRALSGLMFDRYLLPLLAIAMIVVLRLYQQKVASQLPILTLACTVLIAAYGVAALHDVFVMERARLAATEQLRAAGFPRTAFYGGFEYDGWTQMEAWGYVNSDRLRLPAGLATPDLSTLPVKPCNYIFYRQYAAIRPQYALSFDDRSCSGPAPFNPTPYTTWLPPYSGSIYVRSIAPPR